MIFARFRFLIGFRLTVVGLLIVLLVGCSEANRPPQPLSTATPVGFLPVGEILANRPVSGAEVTVAGYLVVDQSGARLVDGLSFSVDTTAQPLSQDQIWLGATTPNTLTELLRPAGALRYAAVTASGQLEGPGAYGPGTTYRYQILNPSLHPLVPQETTITVLTNEPDLYENRLVRVVGSLLARDDSALLVERVGAGGLPEPGVGQIKLRAPLRDQALLERLQTTKSGAVRFGQVQVEGFWRQGVLLPLSILPVT